MAKENLIKERESKTDIAYRLMSKRKNVSQKNRESKKSQSMQEACQGMD